MFTRNRVLIIFAFIAIYLSTVIAQLPAQLLNQFLPANSPIKYISLSGTIWNGAALNASANLARRNITIGDIEWRLHAHCLLLLRACIDFNIQPKEDTTANIRLTTRTTTQLNQSVRLENTTASANAAWLVQMAGLPISAVGTVALSADYVEINPTEPLPSIAGELRVLNAGVDFPEAYQLGDYQLALITLQEQDQKTLRGVLSDSSNILNTSGNIDIKQNGQVLVDLKVAPTPQAPTAIKNFLSFVSKADSNGVFSIRQNTTINSIF